MAFPNVRRIARIGAPLSSYKLILAVGMSSRPKYRKLLYGMLWPFVRNGEISIRYRCCGRAYTVFLRVSDLASDVLSARELCVSDIYRLDGNFHPDVVIDGGGNIGLFTLRAAACYGSGNSPPIRLVVCEPLPRNIEQIRKHLAINRLQAQVMACCLGGTRRSIPFYCRGANESSFDPILPYDSVLQVPVVLLQDAIGATSAERILIKLDIEGMEVETLTAYLPTENRAVYIVGELHDRPTNMPVLQRLFDAYGWTLEFFDIDEVTASFRACSPLAVKMLGWAATRNG
jgi:FkbM family methyltransferase